METEDREKAEGNRRFSPRRSCREILIDRTRAVFISDCYFKRSVQKKRPKTQPEEKKLKESKNIAQKFRSKIESSEMREKYLATIMVVIYDGLGHSSFSAGVFFFLPFIADSKEYSEWHSLST